MLTPLASASIFGKQRQHIVVWGTKRGNIKPLLRVEDFSESMPKIGSESANMMELLWKLKAFWKRCESRRPVEGCSDADHSKLRLKKHSPMLNDICGLFPCWESRTGTMMQRCSVAPLAEEGRLLGGQCSWWCGKVIVDHVSQYKHNGER